MLCTITNIVDTSFKYFMALLDSVPVADTTCCLMFFKNSSFNISATSTDDGNFLFLLAFLTQQRTIFSTFSVIDPTFV